MRDAVLVTENNWPLLSNRYGIPGPMKDIYVDRYYFVDTTRFWKRTYIMVAAPAFIGEIATLGNGKKVRR
jgi:hypothetical protein